MLACRCPKQLTLSMFYAFQLLPGVKVVIANPDTKGQCADSHLGEVSPRLAEVQH